MCRRIRSNLDLTQKYQKTIWTNLCMFRISVEMHHENSPKVKKTPLPWILLTFSVIFKSFSSKLSKEKMKIHGNSSIAVNPDNFLKYSLMFYDFIAWMFRSILAILIKLYLKRLKKANYSLLEVLILIILVVLIYICLSGRYVHCKFKYHIYWC